MHFTSSHILLDRASDRTISNFKRGRRMRNMVTRTNVSEITVSMYVCVCEHESGDRKQAGLGNKGARVMKKVLSDKFEGL